MLKLGLDTFTTVFSKLRRSEPQFGINVSKSVFTDAMTGVHGFLEKLGQREGYEVRREYLRIDQWWRRNASNIAIEHELSPQTGKIWSEEFPKLMDVCCELKTLVIYQFEDDFSTGASVLADQLNRQLTTALGRRRPPCFDEFLLVIGTKDRGRGDSEEYPRTFARNTTDCYAERFYDGGSHREILRSPQ